MKTKYFLRSAFCLLLITLSFSCSKDGGSDVVDMLIPDLTAGWANTANSDDNYFFLVDNVGAASSTFSGNEVSNQGSTVQNFTGSYQNSKINFTFSNGVKQGIKYTGKINGNQSNATMTLTIPNGTLTLQKH